MLNNKALAASVSAGPVVYVEDVFSTWLYTGNGSTQTITNGIDLSGKGGLVWVKARGSTSFGNVDHALHDSARGVTNSLLSSSNSGQFDQTTSGVTVFNSSGFAIGSGPRYNESPVSYASWTFRKQAKFFDVVTYTGNGSNRTIAHNLGSVPGTILVKRTDTSGDWQVYHRSLANTEYMVLNSTAAKVTGATRWNSTTPTSTEFSLGTDATVNANTGTYVAYLFAHNAGGFGTAGTDSVISCGSFTSDSSGNATVTLGWEPQWLLFKRTDSTGSWALHDTMRGGSLSASSDGLSANTSEAEGAGTSNYAWNPTATGFQFRASLGGSGATYIYIAIRRGPMKTPTSATSVFSALSVSNPPTPYAVSTSFPVDLILSTNSTLVRYRAVNDRLRGGNPTSYRPLFTNTTDAEGSYGGIGYNFASNTSVIDHSVEAGQGGRPLYYSFRRAPGFFDVVAYTGTGSATTVSHNLGVVPELMLVKSRSVGAFWRWYWAPLGATKNFYMPNDEASVTQTEIWNNTSPTSTVFTVGTSTDTNFSARTYIAYLFASLTGISKVGSYTGTGTTLNIDCGFTAGARFVLIKRSDSTGDWYVYDTARGIVSGNDPFLLINSTAAENTSTDYIDPLSSGFQISSTAPAAINANGGTFVYLAIA